MTVTEVADTKSWIGRPVVDLDGKHLGALERVFASAGAATWLVVASETGDPAYIPANMAQAHGGAVHVPYSAKVVDTAPATGFDQGALARHYGLDIRPLPGPATGQTVTQPSGETVGTEEIVRWEEEVVLDVQRVQRGRVRVRKVIVTEDVHLTVPVRREVARIVFEPISSSDDLGDGPGEAVELDREIVLHEEVPVVTTKFVAKERLRITVESITSDAPVTARVRRERFEFESDDEALLDQIKR